MPKVNFESERVQKSLKNLPDWKKKQILNDIADTLSNLTHKTTGIKWIKTSKAYRLQIGDYRVFYQRDGDTVTVVNIRPRKDSYKPRQK